MDKKYWWFLAGVLAGYVGAKRLGSLPVVNKIPQA